MEGEQVVEINLHSFIIVKWSLKCLNYLKLILSSLLKLMIVFFSSSQMIFHYVVIVKTDELLWTYLPSIMFTNSRFEESEWRRNFFGGKNKLSELKHIIFPISSLLEQTAYTWLEICYHKLFPLIKKETLR